jgi:hypothetical protein
MARHSGIDLGSPSGLPIIIFGLKDREDRWQRCEEILKEEGIEATFYKTEKRGNIRKDPTVDFLNMLKEVKTDILFFENDFELTKDWREVLTKSYVDLPLSWELLFLGANLTTPAERVTQNLVKIRGAWMFHAVLMRKKFIDYLVKYYDINRHWVFDEWIRRVSVGREFYMTYPMISYQREGYSDLAKKEFYYDIFENKNYRKL